MKFLQATTTEKTNAEKSSLSNLSRDKAEESCSSRESRSNAEAQAEKKLTKEKIICLLKLVYYEKKSIKQSAKYLNVNYNTAKRIIKQFRKNKLGNRSSFNETENKGFFALEVQKLHQNFNCNRKKKDSSKSCAFSTENNYTNVNYNNSFNNRNKNYDFNFSFNYNNNNENELQRSSENCDEDSILQKRNSAEENCEDKLKNQNTVKELEESIQSGCGIELRNCSAAAQAVDNNVNANNFSFINKRNEQFGFSYADYQKVFNFFNAHNNFNVNANKNDNFNCNNNNQKSDSQNFLNLESAANAESLNYFIQETTSNQNNLNNNNNNKNNTNNNANYISINNQKNKNESNHQANAFSLKNPIEGFSKLKTTKPINKALFAIKNSNATDITKQQSNRSICASKLFNVNDANENYASLLDSPAKENQVLISETKNFNFSSPQNYAFNKDESNINNNNNKNIYDYNGNKNNLNIQKTNLISMKNLSNYFNCKLENANSRNSDFLSKAELLKNKNFNLRSEKIAEIKIVNTEEDLDYNNCNNINNENNEDEDEDEEEKEKESLIYKKNKNEKAEKLKIKKERLTNENMQANFSKDLQKINNLKLEITELTQQLKFTYEEIHSNKKLLNMLLNFFYAFSAQNC